MKTKSTPPETRPLCTRCLQCHASCYCARISPFDSGIQFVILIHPHEVRRRVATGRMAHLCLQNSSLIMGHEFNSHDRVNALIADPNNIAVISYPGTNALDLNLLTEAQKSTRFPRSQKNLVVFVIDGTWATAKTMLRNSPNLRALPQIKFTPATPSTFRVRKQPHPLCHSTIEAIHQVIELLGESQGFATSSRLHDNLLSVFDAYVERQLLFAELARAAKIRAGTYFPRENLNKKISFIAGGSATVTDSN